MDHRKFTNPNEQEKWELSRGDDERIHDQGLDRGLRHNLWHAYIGVTAGGDVDVRSAIARGFLPGPRLLTSISPVNENTEGNLCRTECEF